MSQQLNQPNARCSFQEDPQGRVILSSSTADSVLDRAAVDHDCLDSPAYVLVPYPLEDGHPLAFCIDRPDAFSECKFGIGFASNPSDVAEGKLMAGCRVLYNNGSTNVDGTEVKERELPFSQFHEVRRSGDRVIITADQKEVASFPVLRRVFPFVSLRGPPGLTVRMDMTINFAADTESLLKEIHADVQDIYDHIEEVRQSLLNSRIDPILFFPTMVAVFGMMGVGKSSAINTIVSAFFRVFKNGDPESDRKNVFPALSGGGNQHVSIAHKKYTLARPGVVQRLDLKPPPFTLMDTFGCPSDPSKLDNFFKGMALGLKGALDEKVDAHSFATFAEVDEMQRTPELCPPVSQLPAVALILVNGEVFAKNRNDETQLEFLRRAIEVISNTVTIPLQGRGPVRDVPQRRLVICITHAEALDDQLQYKDVRPQDYSIDYKHCVNRIRTECPGIPDTDILPCVSYVKGDKKGSLVRDLHALRIMKACTQSAMEWYGDILDTPGGYELLRASAAAAPAPAPEQDEDEMLLGGNS